MSMSVKQVFDVIEKLPISNPGMVKKSIDSAFEKMIDDADSKELRKEIVEHRNQVNNADTVDEIKFILEGLEEERKRIDNQ